MSLGSQKECVEHACAFTKRRAFITCLEIFYALIQNHIIAVDRERDGLQKTCHFMFTVKLKKLILLGLKLTAKFLLISMTAVLAYKCPFVMLTLLCIVCFPLTTFCN